MVPQRGLGQLRAGEPRPRKVDFRKQDDQRGARTDHKRVDEHAQRLRQQTRGAEAYEPLFVILGALFDASYASR